MSSESCKHTTCMAAHFTRMQRTVMKYVLKKSNFSLQKTCNQIKISNSIETPRTFETALTAAEHGGRHQKFLLRKLQLKLSTQGKVTSRSLTRLEIKMQQLPFCPPASHLLSPFHPYDEK
jgi:hypothetical protein